MLRHITFTVFITTSMNTLATGMVPETSVLLVDEKRGEASTNIKNTDDHPSLLYTT
ncbi:fimbrial chaperone protein, partial [Escherichia coli]|nr:fimbrial chaperone protein [Escherichia coli]